MTQKRALELMLRGRNIFLTGPPGSGKTYLLKEFIKESISLGKKVAVTATTGVAATHLSGQTINSWAGIGYGKQLKSINRDALKERFNNTDIVVIDEISMMDPKTFKMIDILCRIYRKSNAPFGGLQLILTGDFFQLPPVSKKAEEPMYVYQSASWADLELDICYLNGQYRQNKSNALLKVLLAIRAGNFSEIEQKIVSTRMYKLPKVNKVIRLMSHNYDVEQINKKNLDKLNGNTRIYDAISKGEDKMLTVLKSQVLAPEKLVLKINSEVMFVVNNPSQGYVNGSRGIVKELCKDLVVVKVYGGGYVNLRRHKYILDDAFSNDIYIKQFPIKLAWALTIHKSQGMTLDKAIVDLSHAFLPNMGYVALSRLKSIEGLYLRDFNKMAFAINSDIRAIDKKFKKLSAQLSD